MPLAAVAAPASGGQVVFSLRPNDQVALGADPQGITIYVAALAQSTQQSVPQRKQILAWLQAHDRLSDAHSASSPSLQTTTLGKPYWPGSHWQFNWSHSQHMLALAIAPRTLFAPHRLDEAGSLGIDIECLGRQRARPTLVQRYFHPDEHAHADDENGFLRIWTRKESLVKAHGLGLRIDLKSLNSAASPVTHPVIGNWHCHSFALHGPPDATGLVVSLSWPAQR
ncbi:4'-phosphopantetheinyl transferase [Paraperlucidibaca baekdonensis]|uniref:4'-phosphopantetheinyl transferase n=1 Tax=Paraperlucidibaca baekdonensis TaxID=748120 RepID=A0A3E0H9L9_9GAMM|nr:4'-phosphopantetheinyl transferase superfamily protein [Paraperlucidibaca baekdonensis]REH40401.1 4'-phosphopantetheinyl transferase [Paraperlucidibaca baekdonensis]